MFLRILFTSSIPWALLLLACWPTSSQRLAIGQDEIKTTTNPPAAGSAEAIDSIALGQVSEWEEAAFTLRKHLKEMRLLAIKYHLSDTPAQSKPLAKDWIKMLAVGRKLHQQMIDTAVKEYLKDKTGESKAGEMLYYVALRSTHADRFEGMWEVAKALKEQGHTGEQLDFCVGFAAVAQGEFAFAKPFLENTQKGIEKSAKTLMEAKDVGKEERESVGKKMMELYSLCSDLMMVEKQEQLWAEELKAREADAAGEPLPRVQIDTTKGEFVVELFENEAPKTVANFIELCEKGFYDGLPFHRVIEHFMVQGGCPNRDGSGGPGYTIRTELGENKHRNFFRGTLGMALSNAPDTGGSQFFICYLPRSHLNGQYVAFGRVIEGMDVLSDFTHINPDDKHDPHNGDSLPDEILSTRVLRKRAHEYKAERLVNPN